MEPPGGSVIIDLSIADDGAAARAATGALVVSWLDSQAADHLRRDNRIPPASLRAFVARAHCIRAESTALRAGLSLALAPPRGAGALYPVAVFDQTSTFWASMLGGGGNLIGVGTNPAQDDRVAVQLRPADSTSPAATMASRCPQRLHERTVSSGAGGSHRICVYLPADYAHTRGRRHPVVYLLPGLGGDHLVRFRDRTLTDAADAAAGERQAGAILVGIDARTPFGSWYLADRETDWSRWLTRELVEAVDGEFRTLATPEHRFLLGQSTGGFNAVLIALTRPGVFGAVIASVPDALDLGDWLLWPDGRVKEDWLAWMRMEEVVQGPGQMLSYAHSWSPSAHGGYEWPVDLASGAVIGDVLDRWLAQSPRRIVSQPRAAAALRSLGGRLFIGASSRDEFDLLEPAQRFSRRLDDLRIAHHLIVYESGHFEAQSRIADLLATVLAQSPDSPDSNALAPV